MWVVVDLGEISSVLADFEVYSAVKKDSQSIYVRISKAWVADKRKEQMNKRVVVVEGAVCVCGSVARCHACLSSDHCIT